eukprot:TRINITY_DN2652_c4_g1_i1.p1 TRINITY_DN2652_c4_g1~~TRINITY_DN2652_c4_g1_i1.p1  ORF type:complete len:379 (+),score=114.52 TRINITY_DN2652_c4_g1_i1:86-1138(+)
MAAGKAAGGYEWVLWSLLTLCCYSGNNFLLDAVAEEADDAANANVSAIFLVWAAAGVCGYSALLVQFATGGRAGVLPCLGGRCNGALAVGAGVLCGCGTLTLSLGLAIDPDSAGPITAVLPLNSLIVCLLAWTLLGERLSPQHVAGVLIAVVGPVLMAVADTSSSALGGLGFGCAAALCFGFSNYLRKWARAGGAGAGSVVVLVFCAIGAMSVVAVGGCYAIGRGLKGLEDGKLVLFAVGSGALWSVGSLFFQWALAGLAGPASAIANVNSVLVLVLQIIFFSPSLQALKLVGMGVCLLGITVLSLAPRPAQRREQLQPESESEDEEGGRGAVNSGLGQAATLPLLKPAP